MEKSGRSSNLSNSLTNSLLHNLGPTLALDTLGQKGENDVLDLVESSVTLVKRVNVVLNLSHGELSINRLQSSSC